MDIQVVLEASAVATVIGAGISYLTFRNSSKLTYITQERKEWRAEIRKIAEKLEECPYEERNRVLVKLKTRINAYGKTDSRKTWNICEDSHIWEKIEQIERCTTEKEYNIYREQLIYFLSLMLKTDWERAKKEVTGEPWKFTQLIGGVCCVVYLMLYFYEEISDKTNILENVLKCVAGKFGVVILLMLVFGIIKGLLAMGNTKEILAEFVLSILLWGTVIIIGFMLCNLRESIYLLVVGGSLGIIGICQIIIDFGKYADRQIYISRIQKIDPSFRRWEKRVRKITKKKEVSR